MARAKSTNYFGKYFATIRRRVSDNQFQKIVLDLCLKVYFWGIILDFWKLQNKNTIFVGSV